MKVVGIVPVGLRKHFVKFRWFIKNYKAIQYNSEFFNNIHGQLTYNTDGLATSNNCDFIHEPRFAKAYEAAKKTNPWPGFTLMWRVYIVCWFADHIKNLEGDFVECGVNTGAYARAIIEYTGFDATGKTFYLFDTFRGIDAKYVSSAEKEIGILNYKYRDTYEEVVKTFSTFKTKIVRGTVPETLSEFDADKVCYLSIDMNNIAPEIAALEYFWNKIVPGGVIILDDYGFPQHRLQKEAFDKFATRIDHSILSLPTGQGIIIKKGAAL